jgi:SAM-dependent methyltransferase
MRDSGPVAGGGEAGRAGISGTGRGWWDEFFGDRGRDVPIFGEWPDESLAGWVAEGRLAAGRVLELGSGNGRNAVWLAGRGWVVDAVDFSARAIEWAGERAAAAGVSVSWQCCSIFDAAIEAGAYDLVYDSGCFHHLAPHQREEYVGLVGRALKTGGSYGLVCFRPEGGSGYTDDQVYEQGSLGGGLGYTEERLRGWWDQPPFEVRVLRPMNEPPAGEQSFGRNFLWALLATKTGNAAGPQA